MKKYYCYEKNRRSKVTDAIATNTYKNVVFVNGYDELIKLVEPGDTAIFRDITSLDSDDFMRNDVSIGTMVKNYMELLKKDVDIMFDISSNCDSDIIYSTIATLKDQNALAVNTSEAFRILLELQASSYINIRRALAVDKRNTLRASVNLNGKSYGRPVGTTRTTEKEIRTKEIIKTYSREFGGTKTDAECIEMSGVSRNMYYIYKKQLVKEKGDSSDENV